jgi:hypothetical protein
VCFFRSVKNDLNPVWTHVFETTYAFGKETKFNVGIFDQGNSSGKPKTMGSACFEIGEVLAARGSVKAKTLRDGGTIFVRVVRATASSGGTVRGKFRGLKLKNTDGLFGKSDPFYTISNQINAPSGRAWQPVYRSEIVMNDLNPVWNSFQLPLDKFCDGNKDLPLLIEVFDWEKNGKHKSMGSFETTVNSLIFLMGGSDKRLPLLYKKQAYGFIQVDSLHVTESTAGSTASTPSSGPPPKFIKVGGINKVNPEYKKWKDAQTASAPASASVPAPVATAITHSVAPTTGQTMSNPQPFAALPPPILPPSIGGSSGSLGEKPSFVDYIAGGTEINLIVAIDYTGSNGDPRKPGTLHYIHPDGQLNDYEKALTAVGSIVARYDSDQMFPVLGFGAKYGGVIQHCFQVGKEPELRGISGMLQGYRGVFQTGLTMSGPTVFAEVIDFAAAQARSKQERNRTVGQQTYSILLILTDGAVSDIEQTKRSIRNASDSPLSIVIVGIGSADFSAMQFLDDFQSQEGGHTRDIVQFVEFSRHKHDKETLTRETLDEIPDQLVEYFYRNRIMPLPPVSGSKLSINPESHNPDEDIDLTLSINSEGEVNLSKPAEATWDAHSYPTASKFLSSAPAPSYGGQQQPSTYGGGNAYGGVVAPAPSYGGQQQPSTYGGGNAYGGGTAYGGGSAPYAMATATPVAPTSTPVQIQAPANSYPGMQLQVQNPKTGQFQIITVPQGVAPGSRFIVQL